MNVAQVGQVGGVVRRALERFGELPLASIREVSLPPVLELCYGLGERCAVSMTAAEGPTTTLDDKPWAILPPPGTLGFGDAPGLGYVVRGGIYVTIKAR